MIVLVKVVVINYDKVETEVENTIMDGYIEGEMDKKIEALDKCKNNEFPDNRPSKDKIRASRLPACIGILTEKKGEINLDIIF